MRETLRFRKMLLVYAGNMPPLFLRSKDSFQNRDKVYEIRDNVISQVYSTRCHGFELDCKLN